MRIKNTIYALLTALVLLLSSCAKEPYADEQAGEKVAVQIRTKAIIGGVLDGVTVDKIRLLLFDKNQNLVLNSTTSNGMLVEESENQFSIDVETGVYKFVVVINETPELTPKLNATTSYSEAIKTKVEWQPGILTDQNVPLVNYGTLEISKGSTPGQGVGKVTEFDGTTSGPSNPISVTMPRALAKLSLFMRKGDAVTENITINRVEIINIPQHWSVGQQEATQMGQGAVVVDSKEIGSDTGETTHESKKYHNFLASGYIFPEKYFATEDKSSLETNAAFLFISATFGGIPTTYKILLRESDADFRLHRGTNYNVYATISAVGAKGIYVVIEPVKMHNIAVNWKPVEGLVVVSDREADLNNNVNVWSDYSVYSGILKVYQGDAYHDVLFKYGSLIAVNNDAAASTEQAFTAPTSVEQTNDVIWYPGEGFNVTAITDWTSIPYLSDGSSFTSGNTEPLIIAGKGDPCRLAALTPSQIGVGRIYDNLQWHMATPDEYALLMKAANGTGSENAQGYRSFHELLLPNVKYRDANGLLTASHNNQGHYWSTEGNKALKFSSLGLTTTTFQAATPEEAYTIRCVRNVIPKADITFGNVPEFYYQGSTSTGAGFSVVSNVPYWKMELIKSGEGVGTSTDFDDFSFAPITADGASQHIVEGSYSSMPRIYMKRRESRTSNRSFGIQFTSIHFNGEEISYKFMVIQRKYEIRALLTIDGIDNENWLPGTEDKQYTIHLTLSPTDVLMPVGSKIHVKYFYHNNLRGTSNEIITTAADLYNYDVEMKILKNGTPDVIGLDFFVYMQEPGHTAYTLIGRKSYYQNK